MGWFVYMCVYVCVYIHAGSINDKRETWIWKKASLVMRECMDIGMERENYVIILNLKNKRNISIKNLTSTAIFHFL